jgi:hypothetical protein
MKMFGLFEELQKIVFRKSGQTITVEPATQTGSPTITIPDTGSSASRVVVLADLAQTLTNKALVDNSTTIVDNSDATKKIAFNAAGTTGTTTTLLSSQGANITLTLPPTTDTLVGRDTTDTLTNKTLDNTNSITVKDNVLTLQDNSDTTKQAKFEVSGITTGTTRLFTFPDASTTLVGTDTVQTLTNKTFSGTTNSINIKDTGLTIFDNGDITKSFIFEVSGVTTGTQRTLTVPDANTTLVGTGVTQTLSNKTLDNTNALTVKDNALTLQDNSDVTKQAVFELSGITTGNTRTFTLPDASATLVGTDTVQTLTNKTINGSNNTITNVSLSTGVTGTLPIGNGGTGQTTQSTAFDALSPATTKGDLIAFSTTGVRLPVGTNGQLLTADSSAASGVAWLSPTGTLPSIVSGDKYKNLRVNAAESGVDFSHNHITQDASPLGETIPAGYTLLYPWLTVGSGISYTVTGQLEVAQKLIISGTGSVIVSGSSRVF